MTRLLLAFIAIFGFQELISSGVQSYESVYFNHLQPYQNDDSLRNLQLYGVPTQFLRTITILQRKQNEKKIFPVDRKEKNGEKLPYFFNLRNARLLGNRANAGYLEGLEVNDKKVGRNFRHKTYHHGHMPARSTLRAKLRPKLRALSLLRSMVHDWFLERRELPETASALSALKRLRMPMETLTRTYGRQKLSTLNLSKSKPKAKVFGPFPLLLNLPERQRYFHQMGRGFTTVKENPTADDSASNSEYSSESDNIEIKDESNEGLNGPVQTFPLSKLNLLKLPPKHNLVRPPTFLKLPRQPPSYQMDDEVTIEKEDPFVSTSNVTSEGSLESNMMLPMEVPNERKSSSRTQLLRLNLMKLLAKVNPLNFFLKPFYHQTKATIEEENPSGSNPNSKDSSKPNKILITQALTDEPTEEINEETTQTLTQGLKDASLKAVSHIFTLFKALKFISKLLPLAHISTFLKTSEVPLLHKTDYESTIEEAPDTHKLEGFLDSDKIVATEVPTEGLNISPQVLPVQISKFPNDIESFVPILETTVRNLPQDSEITPKPSLFGPKLIPDMDETKQAEEAFSTPKLEGFSDSDKIVATEAPTEGLSVSPQVLSRQTSKFLDEIVSFIPILETSVTNLLQNSEITPKAFLVSPKLIPDVDKTKQVQDSTVEAAFFTPKLEGFSDSNNIAATEAPTEGLRISPQVLPVQTSKFPNEIVSSVPILDTTMRNLQQNPEITSKASRISLVDPKLVPDMDKTNQVQDSATETSAIERYLHEQNSTAIKRRKRNTYEYDSMEIDQRFSPLAPVSALKGFLLGSGSGPDCREGIVRRALKFVASQVPSFVDDYVLCGLLSKFIQKTCNTEAGDAHNTKKLHYMGLPHATAANSTSEAGR